MVDHLRGCLPDFVKIVALGFMHVVIELTLGVPNPYGNGGSGKAASLGFGLGMFVLCF